MPVKLTVTDNYLRVYSSAAVQESLRSEQIYRPDNLIPSHTHKWYLPEGATQFERTCSICGAGCVYVLSRKIWSYSDSEHSMTEHRFKPEEYKS